VITQFHAGHARRECQRLLGVDLATHSDGSTLWVACGEGMAGEIMGHKVLDICTLPAALEKSEILGSFSDVAAKAEQGIHDQTFVLIRKGGL
jgi:hypothetical protein